LAKLNLNQKVFAVNSYFKYFLVCIICLKLTSVSKA